MLGDRRPADRQLAGDLADRPGLLSDPSEHRPPGGIAKRRPWVNYVSRH
jgi:hypothetical protein